jgi:hypothetical protein
MATGRDFVWILFLNDMRMAHSEDTTPVARADTKEELEALMVREKVEPYTDPSGLPPTSPETEPSASSYRCNSQTWHKSYRKGGPLEWYNPPWNPNCIQAVPRIIDRSEDINLIVEARML